MSLREDLIYVPALLMDMSTGSVILGATFYASRLGASPLIIGVMAAVCRALYVISCQVFGRLSDRVNRKRFPQVACLSLAFLYFLLPLCRNLFQLVTVFSLTGIAMAGLWPALEAWIGERQDGRPLVRRVSLFSLFWTGGLMVGYVSGGYIYDIHFFAPFYFSFAAALCAALLLSIQPNPVVRKLEYVDDECEDTFNEHEAVDRKTALKYLYLGWLANFISYLTLGILRYIFPRFIYELGMAPNVFGRLMMCQAGGQFIMFLILGFTERWHYKFAPLVVFQLLASLGFISIWLSSSPIIWAFGLVIVGLNIGMTYSASMYYSLCGHHDPGGKSGWHESILHTGMLTSTLIGGALANYVGLKSPYLFCAAVALVGIPLQLLTLRRKGN